MSKNLIMKEFAHQDVRSVSAMLSKRGDGREQAWLEIERINTEFSTEVLMEFYRIEARYGRIKSANPINKFLTNRIYLLIAMFIILAI